LKRKSGNKSPRERLSSRQKSLPDKKSAFNTPAKSEKAPKTERERERERERDKPPKTEREKKSVRTTVSGLFSPRRALTQKKLEHEIQQQESPPHTRRTFKSISTSPPESPRNSFHGEKSPSNSPRSPKAARLHRSVTKNEGKPPKLSSSSGGAIPTPRSARFSLPHPFHFSDEPDKDLAT